MEYVYRIHRIPTSDPILLAFLAGKFSSLRLAALIQSPASFSGTFKTESTLPATEWIDRLKRPSVNTFVAVAYAAGTPLEKQTIDAGDWVGSAKIIGPTPKSSFYVPASGGPEPGSDDTETKWHMTAVYNSPAHRGKGVAKLLVLGCLDYVEEVSVGKGTRMRIMIGPDNFVVKAMYAKIGFVHAGGTTLAEAYRANGEGDMVPADGGTSRPEKYFTRDGLVMVRVSLPKA